MIESFGGILDWEALLSRSYTRLIVLGLLCWAALWGVSAWAVTSRHSLVVAHDALAASPEEVDLLGADQRLVLFEDLYSRSQVQSKTQVFDGAASFAVERDGQLFAVPLPTVRELMVGGTVGVDLDFSVDPWPTEPRPGLGQMSERDLAQRVASALAATVSLKSNVLVVERVVGAPYAAAVLQGKLWLNPSLLYLVAGAARATNALPSGGFSCLKNTEANEHWSCSSAPGFFPGMALATLGALRARRRRLAEHVADPR